MSHKLVKWTFSWLVFAALVGCSQTAEPPAKAPVAALSHPEIAKVGEKVRLHADATWFDAEAAKSLRDGATIVRYTFLIADGSSQRTTAAAFLDHTFSDVGSYAIAVTAEDDLGRTSVAKSVIHVANDYTGSCDATTANQCGSGACAGDRCAVFACAGDKACAKLGAASGTTTCEQGTCVAPTP